MRIELDGDWAELRAPNKIPHGLTMEYREVFFEMVAASAPAEDISGLKGEARKKAEAHATQTLIERGGLMADQRLKNALVLAIVKEWSFGPVDLKTLLEVPTADLTTILANIDADEYVKVLTPDFDDRTNREPGSPYLALRGLRAALEGKTPEFPAPWWLRQAHEYYRLGQACPWWKPPDDTSGLVVLAIVEVHAIYETLRIQQQVNLLGGMFGGK